MLQNSNVSFELFSDKLWNYEAAVHYFTQTVWNCEIVNHMLKDGVADIPTFVWETVYHPKITIWNKY